MTSFIIDKVFSNENNTFDVLDPNTAKFKTYRYPSDIGGADRGHYVAFFVRTRGSSPLSNMLSSNEQTFNNRESVAQELSQLGVVNHIKKSGKSLFNTNSMTSLTNESIVLYMPDTLNFDTRHSYSNLSPGRELLGQAIAVGPELLSRLKAGDFKGFARSAMNSGAGQMLAKEAVRAVGISGENTIDLGMFAMFGQVLNPMLEMLYTSPELRTFQFEFFFYPRSESESKEVLDIIELFNYHSAPELGRTGMLIPPSEFDISFFYRGKINPNIPPIGTCVLTSVQTNYAPKGFATYESSKNLDTPTKGGTGMPVAIQMSLSFTETTYLTKDDYSIRKDQSTTSSISTSNAAKDGAEPVAKKMLTAQDFAGNGKGGPTKKRNRKKNNQKPKVDTYIADGQGMEIEIAKHEAEVQKKKQDRSNLQRYNLRTSFTR